MRNVYPSPSVEAIRRIRLKYDFTQRDMAELALVTPHTWNRWEKGATPMPANVWELVNFKIKTFAPKDTNAPSLEEALDNWEDTQNLTMSSR